MSSHPIVHVEFSTDDQASLARFYSELFGWKVQHIPEMDYTTFDPESGPGGGFSPVGENNPAGTTIVHIGTDDIEASLAKVTSLGGKILVPKSEIPGFGWFALFSDPSGNTVGLYTAMRGQS